MWVKVKHKVFDTVILDGGIYMFCFEQLWVKGTALRG